MTIRTRFSAVMLGAILLSSSAIAGSILWLKWSDLERQALSRPKLLTRPVKKVIEESVVSKDPLVLMSHLNYLLRTHEELVAVRVLREGRWLPAPGSKEINNSPSERWITLSESALVPVPYSMPVEVAVEMRFDREVLLRDSRAAFERSLRSMILVIALVWLMGLPLALWAGKHFIAAIEELERGVDRMAAGEPVLPVPIAKRDEMGALITKFNRMAERLSELDQMKKDFVSSITHELRTPLAAIASYARVLKVNRNLDDIARAQIRHIEAGIDQLTRFIDQLLESARLERGTFDMSPEDVDVSDLLRDVSIFFRARARESDIELSCDLPETTLTAEADPDRLREIMTNLVGNALKFTPAKGRVTVYAKPSRLEGKEALEIGVIDTGVGIHEKDLHKLFRPFERIKSVMKTTGTGLGLSISKAIAEMHGGRIAVDSQPGKGSRFYFTIPVVQVREKAAAQ